MTEFNLIEKIGEWFESLKSFRNTEIRQIYLKDKEQLDKIHEEFVNGILGDIDNVYEQRQAHNILNESTLIALTNFVEELKQKIEQKAGFKFTDDKEENKE